MRAGRFAVRILLFGCGGGAATSGCAHATAGQEERKFAQLRDDLARVQADHDRVDQRLTALEVRAADDAKLAESRGVAPAMPTSPTPKLRVVHLSPDGHEVAEPAAQEPAAEDHRPRPSIRVTGRGRGRRGETAEHVEQTLGDDESAVGADEAKGMSSSDAATADMQARRAYDAALALAQAKQYDRALESFAGFLVRWPDHPNADSAMYWRGECYFAKGEYVRAIEQFEGLLARFPRGGKAPDALLKLGIGHQKLGSSQKAKSYFDRLVHEFPRSDAAKKAAHEETR